MQGIAQFLQQIWQFIGWSGLSTIAAIVSSVTAVIEAFFTSKKGDRHTQPASVNMPRHTHRRRKHRR